MQKTPLFKSVLKVCTYTQCTFLQLRAFYSNKESISSNKGQSWRFARGQQKTGVPLFHLSPFSSALKLPLFFAISLSFPRAMIQKGRFTFRWCGPPLSVLTLQWNPWHSPGCAYTGLLRRAKERWWGKMVKEKGKGKITENLQWWIVIKKRGLVWGESEKG